MDEGLNSGVEIVSDGTAEGTRVILDGEERGKVTNVTWKFSKGRAQVILDIQHAAVAEVQLAAEERRANFIVRTLGIA